MNTAVLIMFVIMLVPISAILSNVYLKSQRLKSGLDENGKPLLSKGGETTPKQLGFKRKPEEIEAQTEKLTQNVADLLQENEELRKRLENLETIVTSVEWDEVTKQADKLKT